MKAEWEEGEVGVLWGVWGLRGLEAVCDLNHTFNTLQLQFSELIMQARPRQSLRAERKGWFGPGPRPSGGDGEKQLDCG